MKTIVCYTKDAATLYSFGGEDEMVSKGEKYLHKCAVSDFKSIQVERKAPYKDNFKHPWHPVRRSIADLSKWYFGVLMYSTAPFDYWSLYLATTGVKRISSSSPLVETLVVSGKSPDGTAEEEEIIA